MVSVAIVLAGAASAGACWLFEADLRFVDVHHLVLMLSRVDLPTPYLVVSNVNLEFEEIAFPDLTGRELESPDLVREDVHTLEEEGRFIDAARQAVPELASADSGKISTCVLRNGAPLVGAAKEWCAVAETASSGGGSVRAYEAVRQLQRETSELAEVALRLERSMSLAEDPYARQLGRIAKSLQSVDERSQRLQSLLNARFAGGSMPRHFSPLEPAKAALEATAFRLIREAEEEHRKDVADVRGRQREQESLVNLRYQGKIDQLQTEIAVLEMEHARAQAELNAAESAIEAARGRLREVTPPAFERLADGQTVERTPTASEAAVRDQWRSIVSEKESVAHVASRKVRIARERVEAEAQRRDSIHSEWRGRIRDIGNQAADAISRLDEVLERKKADANRPLLELEGLRAFVGGTAKKGLDLVSLEANAHAAVFQQREERLRGAWMLLDRQVATTVAALRSSSAQFEGFTLSQSGIPQGDLPVPFWRVRFRTGRKTRHVVIGPSAFVDKSERSIRPLGPGVARSEEWLRVFTRVWESGRAISAAEVAGGIGDVAQRVQARSSSRWNYELLKLKALRHIYQVKNART